MSSPRLYHALPSGSVEACRSKEDLCKLALEKEHYTSYSAAFQQASQLLLQKPSSVFTHGATDFQEALWVKLEASFLSTPTASLTAHGRDYMLKSGYRDGYFREGYEVLLYRSGGWEPSVRLNKLSFLTVEEARKAVEEIALAKALKMLSNDKRLQELTLTRELGLAELYREKLRYDRLSAS